MIFKRLMSFPQRGRSVIKNFNGRKKFYRADRRSMPKFPVNFLVKAEYL